MQDGKKIDLIYLGKNEFYASNVKQLYRFIKTTRSQPKYIVQVSDGSTWDYNDGPNDKPGPNKHDWYTKLGQYQIMNSTNTKILVDVHIKNGWLYLDNHKLREFRPWLFVDCKGHVLNLTQRHTTWNNLLIKKFTSL